MLFGTASEKAMAAQMNEAAITKEHVAISHGNAEHHADGIINTC